MDRRTCGHLAHLPPCTPQPIVFFTVCVAGKRPILATCEAHEILRDVWTQSLERNGWYVGHYVVMPDHVHFFARSSLDAMPIAKWMGVWKTVSAKRIALTASATTPVWQRDYFDRYLRSSESYAEKWEYVRQNPVRAGLVTDAESWSYWGKIGEIEF